MVLRGGDIRDFTIAGRKFDPAKDNNVVLDLGGITNEVTTNGNGTTQVVGRLKNGSITDVKLSLDDTRRDLEFLQNLANASTANAVTVTLINGIVYSGNLVVSQDVKKSSGDGYGTFSFEGSKIEQI